MKEKLRYCIEYINPRFPLLDSGNLNIRHLRVEQDHFAEIAIDLILSFGGKIISTYKGSVTRGRVADWDAHLELDDKFSNEWLGKVLNEFPHVPGWRKNREDNKPEIKHSVLMFTAHGIAEGEWLGDEWCQYRWSCKVKDSEVLYWVYLSDLDKMPKEDCK